jgi:Na+/proline symporter
LRFLEWSTSFTEEFTIWGGLIGGTFFLLSQYAVDQAELQRFLTTSSVQNSRRALISTMVFTSLYGIVVFFIGTALYVFHLQHPEHGGLEIHPDRVFPRFIIDFFPTGFRGLIIAGVFAASMSTVSSILNSLATVTVRDFYEPLFRREGSVKLARTATILFGFAATVLSLEAGSFGTILVAQGKIRNFFGGSLVGVFLLGMLFPRANGGGAFLSMIVSFFATAALSYLTDVSWMWYSAFATGVSFAVGLGYSYLTGHPPAARLDGLVWRRRSAGGKRENVSN